MREADLKIFVEGTAHYFSQVLREKVIIDPPYQKGEESLSEDLAGVIGISGRQKGAIYFTASREMVRELLTALKIDEITPEMEADVIGEIANTISGNARREFGSEFLISVPMVLSGKNNAISFPRKAPAFVIPILWRSHRCFLMIGLEEGSSSQSEKGA